MNKKQQELYERSTKKYTTPKKVDLLKVKKNTNKHKPNNNLVIIVGVCFVVVIGAVLLLLLNSGSTNSTNPTQTTIGGTLPKLDPTKYSGAANDFKLKDTEGNEHRLSDHGGRLVLLDFTASWCKWCIEQSPDVHKLYQKYGNMVQFYSVDVNEPLQTVINYKNEDGAKWPFLVDGNGKVAKQFQVQGYPFYLLLAKDGSVIKPQSGYSPTFFDDFSQAIESNID
jgi:thiol-disulfide isomerase/thioredoxin